MSLFKRKKNVAPQKRDVVIEIAEPRTSVSFSKEFAQSGSFRGFRRIQLRHIDVEGCSETLDAHRPDDFKFKGSTILVEGIETSFGDETSRLVNVYVDGSIIGCVKSWMDKELDMLFDYEYDKVHLRVEEPRYADGSPMGANIYLFVRYPGEAPIKTDYRTE